MENFDYSQTGAYFITLCTQNRKKIFSKIIVGTGVLDCPKIHLLNHGKIADKYIHQLNNFYNDISVDKYIIMPDHVIRNEQDYIETWEYIENNPKRWVITQKETQGD